MDTYCFGIFVNNLCTTVTMRSNILVRKFSVCKVCTIWLILGIDKQISDRLVQIHIYRSKIEIFCCFSDSFNKKKISAIDNNISLKKIFHNNTCFTSLGLH